MPDIEIMTLILARIAALFELISLVSARQLRCRAETNEIASAESRKLLQII